MTNESISIIIKVGKKSNMKFSHSKAYRALIPEDLEILHRNHPDCHLVIIENIKEDEEDAVRKFIQSFESESDDNKVLFYIPDEDDLETLGLADELNFDIYMTLEDIYFAMKDLGYSLDVAATLDSRREYFKEMSKTDDLEGVTDIFGGIGEGQDSIDTDVDNEAENQHGDFDDSDTSEKQTSKVSLAKEASEENETDLFDGMDSFECGIGTVEEKEDSTQKIESTQETKSTQKIEGVQETKSSASELSGVNSEEIDKLRAELRDARYNYGVAVKDVQEANKRIEDLESVIKALKDEKKDIVDRFNAIKDNGEVFDDADYSELERKLQQSESSIVELTAELNKEKSEVEKLTTDLNDKVRQLNELNSKVESGEIHAEIVADYEKKLSELSDKYKDTLEKFENEQGKVSEISDSSSKELKVMRLDLTNAKNERDRFKGDIDRLNKQLKGSEEKVESITKERDDLKKKVKSLEKEKDDTTKERDNLKAECDGLKSERDMLKIDIGDIEADKENLAERVESLEKEKSDLEKEKSDLEKEKSDLEKKKSDIEGKQAGLRSEKEKLINEKRELANDKIRLTNEKITLEDEIKGLKDRQKSIEAEKSELESKKNSLVEKVNQLESLEGASEKNEESLNKKIETLAKEKSDIEEKIKAFESEKEQLNKKVSTAEDKADAAEFAKFEVEETATALKKSVEALNIKLNDKQSEVEQLKATITNLNLQLDECKADLGLATEANSRILEQQGDTDSQHKSEIDSLKQQISSLETKLKLTNEQLEQKEQQYSILVAQQADKSAGANVLANTNKTLEIVNKTLSEQLSVANKEINALKNSKTRLTSEVKTYRDRCNQLDSALKNTVKALGSGASNTEKKEQTGNSDRSNIGGQYLTVKPINYTGSAKIVPVFGCGGTGITTAAVSLASKICLTSNVLYIDMDITQASADAWFSQTPLCGGLSGLGLMDIECTGLGIFYEKGFNTFNNNLDKIIKNVEHTKGGGTDYLSGLIHRVDDERIANADYTSLFNRLGEKYTYIVVDLGRVGNSRVNDSLIKAIFDISATNIAVVPQNYFSIRNFILKVNEAKLDMRKLKLIINMCTATALDRRTKQALTSKSISKYAMILLDQNMVCIKDTFIHNKLNRDKFAAFVNSDLF